MLVSESRRMIRRSRGARPTVSNGPSCSDLRLPIHDRFISLVFGRSSTLMINGGHDVSPLAVTPRRHRLALANSSDAAVLIRFLGADVAEPPPLWIIARSGRWTPVVERAEQGVRLDAGDCAQALVDFALAEESSLILADESGARNVLWDVSLPAILPDKSFNPSVEPWLGGSLPNDNLTTQVP